MVRLDEANNIPTTRNQPHLLFNCLSDSEGNSHPAPILSDLYHQPAATRDRIPSIHSHRQYNLDPRILAFPSIITNPHHYVCI
jgi:hypothetical protein